MNYLDNLNERQKEAVLHQDGPLLIVAGAGAGKTKTITHRIARLIETGVPARSILAVTFTNKAAQEMRARVQKLLQGTENGDASGPLPGTRRGGPLLCTFHALCVRLLREFHKEAGLPRGFSIWDRDDSLRAIKRAAEALDLRDRTPAAYLAAISRQKGEGVTSAEYAEAALDFRREAVLRVWEAYEKTLNDEDALDFDDLLLRTLHLLRGDARVLSRLKERFRYLHVDEYQDTNRVQYDIAALLAGETKNLCVVGDTDQNIYSWRGADLGHLLAFEETFPGAKVVLLEQNYRSTRTILSAANAVIGKNRRRTPKRLFTENETGEPLLLFSAANEMEEAYFVAGKTKELLEEGARGSDIAVLYRENFQSRAIEEAFLRLGIPYRVLGVRFFERKEVKDVLSYLRAALNPKSHTDIARAASAPSRGIGASTLRKMFSGETFSGALARKVEAFRLTLDDIAKALATLPASEAVRFCIEKSGVTRMYKEDTDEGRDRLENIRELLNLSVAYDFDEPPSGIEKLLEEAALKSDQDDSPLGAEAERSKDADAVSLMTVHASKGLEFEAVFVTGLEQGLFPSMRETPERDPEEERRLFYVALTRARRRLFLSHALERMRWGTRERALPSEFIDDIDPRLVEHFRRERADHEEHVIE